MSNSGPYWGLSQEAALETAARYIADGNLAVGEVICRKVLEDQAANTVAKYLIGEVAARLGLVTAAMDCFRSAIDLDDKYLPTLTVSAREGATEVSPRFLLAKAWGFGFWSDVCNVLGALLLAEITDRTPIIHWGHSSRFSDGGPANSFRHYFVPFTSATIETIREMPTASIYPPKFTKDNLYDAELNKWKGTHSRLSGLYFLNRSEQIIVTDFYLGVADLMPWTPKHHPTCKSTIDATYRYLTNKYLRPRKEIADEVESFWSTHLKAPTVAVHVRGSDKAAEMPKLDAINLQYYNAIDLLPNSLRFCC